MENLKKLDQHVILEEKKPEQTLKTRVILNFLSQALHNCLLIFLVNYRKKKPLDGLVIGAVQSPFFKQDNFTG